MKSNTVKFNVFNLLLAVSMLTAAYVTQSGIPAWAFTTLTIVGILVSQAITFFSPSGEFVGTGQNWSVGKWIYRIGTSVLSVFALLQESQIGVAVIASITPIVEIIVRVYGTDTEDQRVAARSKGKI